MEILNLKSAKPVFFDGITVILDASDGGLPSTAKEPLIGLWQRSTFNQWPLNSTCRTHALLEGGSYSPTNQHNAYPEESLIHEESSCC